MTFTGDLYTFSKPVLDEASKRFRRVGVKPDSLPWELSIVCSDPLRAGSAVDSVTVRVTQEWAQSPTFLSEAVAMLGGERTLPDPVPSSETRALARSMLCDALTARGFSVDPSSTDEVVEATRGGTTFSAHVRRLFPRRQTHIDVGDVERLLREAGA